MDYSMYALFCRFFYLRSKSRKEKPVLLFTQDLAFTAKSVRKRIYCKPVELFWKECTFRLTCNLSRGILGVPSLIVQLV